MRFSSPGLFSLQGSGELAHEFRGFLVDLETMGQRRQANKLELEEKKQAIAAQKAELERQEALAPIERERLIHQNALELAQLRQQIMMTDIQLANEYLKLLTNFFETKYGADWRLEPGAEAEFDKLAAGGSRLMQEFRDGRISVLGEGDGANAEPGRYGDGGF